MGYHGANERKNWAFVRTDLASAPNKTAVCIVEYIDNTMGRLVDFKLCDDADQAEAFMAASGIINPITVWRGSTPTDGEKR